MPLANVDQTTITSALAKLVDDELVAGTAVVLEPDSPDGSDYYVQFAFDGGRLFCEAVSNEYLEPPSHLDSGQLRALEKLGWGPPEQEGQNWFRIFRPTSPEDYDEIIRLVRRALQDVYRLPHDVPLTMTTTWEGEDLPLDSEIRFASEGHRSTYARVRRYAAEVFDEAAQFDPGRPLIFVQHGSAIVSIAVNPLKIHSSLVECHAWVVTEPPLTDELMQYLLAANYRLPFGGFALDTDGDVVLKYVLLGDTLSEEELKTTLVTVAELADEYDDLIVERFGGHRAADRPRRALTWDEGPDEDEGDEGDEVLCPFCDRNVWRTGEDGPCEHLLADWPLDPSDNGGGVLGEMLDPNEGIADAEFLDMVSQELCEWVCSAGEETVEARLTLAENAIVGEKPNWWWDLRRAIAERIVGANFANSMMEEVIQNLPGISVSYETLGGMTSGTSIFVWSDDPIVGRATIDAAVASVTTTVRMVVETLDDSDS